jgi:hypothetical protein
VALSGDVETPALAKSAVAIALRASVAQLTSHLGMEAKRASSLRHREDVPRNPPGSIHRE